MNNFANNFLDLNESAISLELFFYKLLIGLLIFLIFAFIYKKFNFNAEFKYSNFIVFPVLGLSIVLIISIIKSSIALSLGLVGALSIVRFRTPIKNSEELIYLFLIIGVAIGLGANRFIETVLFSIFANISIIILYLYFVNNRKKNFISNIMTLEVASSNYKKVHEMIENRFPDCKFISLNSFDDIVDIKFSISSFSESKIQELLNLKNNEDINKIIINNLDDLSN